MPSNRRAIAIALALMLPSFAAFCGPALAQERDILELYRLAKAKDPALMRADARLASGRADKDIAWSGLLPRVTASGSVKEFWQETWHANNKEIFDKEIEGNYTGFSYAAGGSLPIVNIPAYRQLAVADAGISSADASVQVARQDLVLRLVESYITFLKAKADEKLYRDEVARVGRVLDQAEAFLKAGTGDVIAVYEAKARVDAAAADLIKNQGLLKVAQQDLAILTGVQVDTVRELTVSGPHGPSPADLQWWTDVMLRRHPDLLRAREDLLQAEEATRVTSAAHYPTIDGNGGYRVDKGQTFLPRVETRQWYAMLSLTLPIYTGGETAARTRRALAGESERRAALEDAKETAIKRLRDAYVTLQYSESLVCAYQRKHESAELQLKAVKKGRDIGTRTAIDLLNAEQSYAVSSRDLSSALYDNQLRQFQLKAAAGILVESDLSELKGALVESK